MFDTILLAVDGSEPSNRATSATAELAHRLGSEVIVLHVKETEITWAASVELESGEEASELVDRTVRMLKDRDVSARGEVHRTPFGRAARVILETAADTDSKLIVMGSRGLSDLAGLVMGSVAHKVLHLARIPVLVVR